MSLLVGTRSFRLLLGATAVSNLGDRIAALALARIATLITRDPAQAAGVAVAVAVPHSREAVETWK